MMRCIDDDEEIYPWIRMCTVGLLRKSYVGSEVGKVSKSRAKITCNPVTVWPMIMTLHF